MIRRVIGWIVLIPLCLLLIVFALANRQLVIVNFNPLVPSEALGTPGAGVPLFLVMFTVLLFGVVIGGIATWFAQGQHRRDERFWRREVDRLNREVDALRRTPGLPTVEDLART